MTPDPIRVALVEDSATQRDVIRRVLEMERDIVVAATARNGREGARAILRVRPDVVVTDVWMPEMDGVAMIGAVLEEYGVPIIVVTASLRNREIDVSFECLAAGAVAILQKPQGPVLMHLAGIGAELRRNVRLFRDVRIRRRRAGAPPRALPESPPPEAAGGAGGRPAVVGIVASTGGPPVLAEILGALPPAYPVPVLVVQHLASGFEAGFIQWLAERTGRTIRPGAHGERLAPGVIFGLNGRHLTVTRSGRIALEAPEPDELHVPSGDRLLSSLAAAYGSAAAGVVCTGMGADGAEGLARIRREGGRTVAQDRASSMIWGMPGEAVGRGAARLELPPAGIAAWLAGQAAGTEA